MWKNALWGEPWSEEKQIDGDHRMDRGWKGASVFPEGTHGSRKWGGGGTLLSSLFVANSSPKPGTSAFDPGSHPFFRVPPAAVAQRAPHTR